MFLRNTNHIDQHLLSSGFHVLFECPLFTDIRDELYSKAHSVNDAFLSLTETEKFSFIFNNHSMIEICSKPAI